MGNQAVNLAANQRGAAGRKNWALGAGEAQRALEQRIMAEAQATKLRQALNPQFTGNLDPGQGKSLVERVGSSLSGALGYEPAAQTQVSKGPTAPTEAGRAGPSPYGVFQALGSPAHDQPWRGHEVPARPWHPGVSFADGPGVPTPQTVGERIERWNALELESRQQAAQRGEIIKGSALWREGGAGIFRWGALGTGALGEYTTGPESSQKSKLTALLRAKEFTQVDKLSQIALVRRFMEDNDPEWAAAMNDYYGPDSVEGDLHKNKLAQEQITKYGRNFLERVVFEIPYVSDFVIDPVLGPAQRAYLDPEDASAGFKYLWGDPEKLPPILRAPREAAAQALLMVGVCGAAKRPAAAISSKLFPGMAGLPQAATQRAAESLATQGGRAAVTAAVEQSTNILRPRLATQLAHWVSTRGIEQAVEGELFVIGENALHMERPSLAEMVATPLAFVGIAGALGIGGKFLDRFSLTPGTRSKLQDAASQRLQEHPGLQGQAREASKLVEAHTARLVAKETQGFGAKVKRSLNAQEHRELREQAALELMEFATGKIAHDSLAAQRIMETLLTNPKHLGTDFGMVLARQLSPKMNTLFRDLGPDAPFMATVIVTKTGQQHRFTGPPGKLRKDIAKGVRDGKYYLQTVEGSASAIESWRTDPSLITDIQPVVLLDEALLRSAGHYTRSKQFPAPQDPMQMSDAPGVPGFGQGPIGDVPASQSMPAPSGPGTLLDPESVAGKAAAAANARALESQAQYAGMVPETPPTPGRQPITGEYGPSVSQVPGEYTAQPKTTEPGRYVTEPGTPIHPLDAHNFEVALAGYDPHKLDAFGEARTVPPAEMGMQRPIASESEKLVADALGTERHKEAQEAAEALVREAVVNPLFPASPGRGLEGAGRLEVGDTIPAIGEFLEPDLPSKPTRDPSPTMAYNTQQLEEGGTLRVLHRGDGRGVLLEDTKPGIRYLSSPLANGSVANFVPTLRQTAIGRELLTEAKAGQLKFTDPKKQATAEQSVKIAEEGVPYLTRETETGAQEVVSSKSPGHMGNLRDERYWTSPDGKETLSAAREYITSGNALLHFTHAQRPARSAAGRRVRAIPYGNGKVMHLIDDTTGQSISMLTDDLLRYVETGQVAPFKSRDMAIQGQHVPARGWSIQPGPVTKISRRGRPKRVLKDLAQIYTNRFWRKAATADRQSRLFKNYAEDLDEFMDAQALLGEMLGLPHLPQLPDAANLAKLHLIEMLPGGTRTAESAGAKLLAEPDLEKAVKSKEFNVEPGFNDPVRVLADSLDIEVRYSPKGQVMLKQKVSGRRIPFLHDNKQHAFATLQHMRQQRMEQARLVQRQFMDDWSAQPVPQRPTDLPEFATDLDQQSLAAQRAVEASGGKLEAPDAPSHVVPEKGQEHFWGTQDDVMRAVDGSVVTEANGGLYGKLNVMGAMKVQTKLMQMGKFGQEIAGMFRDAADLREMTTGRLLNQVDRILAPLTDAEVSVQLKEFIEDGKPVRFEVQQAARQLKAITDDLYAQAAELGVPGLEKMVSNYFPHVWDLVRYHSDTAFKEKLIKAYAARLGNMSAKNLTKLGKRAKMPYVIRGNLMATARELVERKVRKMSVYKSAHLMDERIGLPGYTTNAREAYYAAISRNVRMLAEHRVFGNPAEGVKLKGLGKEGAEEWMSHSIGTHNRMWDAINQLPDDGWKKYASEIFQEEVGGQGLGTMPWAWRELYNWQKMKLSFSGIINSSQSLNTINRVGIKAFMKGMTETNPTSWQEGARDMGALSYGMLAEQSRDGLSVYGLDMDTINREHQGIFNSALKVKARLEDVGTLGMKYTEIMNRGLATNAGTIHFNNQLRILEAERINPFSKKYLRAARDLKDLGIDHRDLLTWVDQGAAGKIRINTTRRLAAKRVSDITQFRGGAQHMPKWARERYMLRAVYQFKTFTVNQASFAYDELIAVPFQRKQYARGAHSWMMFAAAYPAAGLAVNEVKHKLMYQLPAALRGDPSTRESRARQAMNELMEAEGIDKAFALMNLWWTGTVHVGGLGVMTDLANGAQYHGSGWAHEAMSNWWSPVLFSTIGNFVEAGGAIAKIPFSGQPAEEAKTAWRAMTREFGGAGSLLRQGTTPTPKSLK